VHRAPRRGVVPSARSRVGKSPAARANHAAARRYNRRALFARQEPRLDPVAQPSPIAAPAASIAGIQALAAPDMGRVDTLIRKRLASDVVLVNRVAEHIVDGGGKRLRPMLHVLAARAAGYAGEDHIQLAAVIEFIHTATLLHDDVVDESGLRRGRETANALWGNAP